MPIVPSLCRLCVNTCGILVNVQDGRAAQVVGDRDSPVHRGHYCVKGRAVPAFMYHPRRLLHSQKRTATGGYEPIPVDQALDEIALKLRTILDRDGPRAVAFYGGTYQTSTSLSRPFALAFQRAIGATMCFTPNTIDKPGKGIAAALHGTWMAPATGYDEPDAALLVGINPLLTYTGMPYGNPKTWLTDRLRASMKLIVIDPRRTEVAERATLHLQARAGEDATILAGMIRVILAEDLHDGAFVADNVNGLDALRLAVAPFTPEVVSQRADVPASDVVRAAQLFASARRGYAMAGTGPNMSGRGTLVEYLILVLETLTGHWMRAGERVRNPGALSSTAQYKAQARPPVPANGYGERLRVRGLTMSAAGMPTAALPDEILLEGKGQVRALICDGGNPVAAWPDQEKTWRAMRELELLVQIDPWMSQTARQAHYVIAPKMFLEVPGTTLWHDALAGRTGYGVADPYAQYTPALVEPPLGSELIEEWEFYYGMAQRLGFELSIAPPRFAGGGGGTVSYIPVDMCTKPSSDTLIEQLCADARVPLDEVKRHPHGAVFAEPQVHVLPKDPGWPHLLDVGNPEMMLALNTIAHVNGTARDGSAQFPYRLLCRRMDHVYNTSCNDPATNRGRPYNPAFMHPADLADLGVASGDRVIIESMRASIEGIVAADASLRRGLVSMSFGFGDVPDAQTDVSQVGSCTGRLLADDFDFDRYSGQPRMSDLPVRVLPIPSK